MGSRGNVEPMRWELILSISALVIALVAVAIGIGIYRHLKSAPPTPQQGPDPTLPAAFIINPTKINKESFQRRVAAIVERLGVAEPLWWETTVEDPGTGQAKEAIKRGVSTVIAVGGDGTVRSVAAALENSGVPMGLVPRGTGNLFARNLDLPLVSTNKLVEIALSAPVHPVDMGWVHPAGPNSGLPPSTPFLVISGVGFDAAMVADADEELKAWMGWMAYFFAGARHLHGKKIRVRLSIDDEKPVTRKVRSMLVANVGRLPGGFVLFPDAEADSGKLDIASIDTRMSVVGWTSLLGTVVLQGVGIRAKKPRPTSDLEFWRATNARIDIDQPAQLQVDGDLIGPITSATFTVNPGALLMRYEP